MVSNRGPSAYQPTALPLGQTGSHNITRFGNYSYSVGTHYGNLLKLLVLCEQDDKFDFAGPHGKLYKPKLTQSKRREKI